MDPQLLAALAQIINSGSFGLGAGDSSGLISAFGPPGLGSFMQGRKAKKAKKKAQDRFSRALSATEAIQGRGLQTQEALARQATAQQLAGFDAAKREAARFGREAKQSALDRETQLGARASQGLASRGLGNTTIGANLQRGIASDTNRELSRVNEGLGGIFGDLAMGRAGVEAQGTQNLAGILGAQTDLQSQLAQMRLLGGGTLGSLGHFDPGAFSMPGAGAFGATQEGIGSFLGSLGGGGGQPGMNPQFLQFLFGGG